MKLKFYFLMVLIWGWEFVQAGSEDDTSEELSAVLRNEWIAAIKSKRLKNIKRLLPRININAELSDNGITALHIAANEESYKVIRFLLTVPGINVNKVALGIDDHDNGSPLDIAIRNNKKNDCVSLFLNCNDIIVNEDDDNWSSLHLAVEKNDVKSVRMLLDIPYIDINYQNTEGETPLHLAIKYKRVTILKMLLNMPAIDIMIKNNDGETAMDLLKPNGSDTDEQWQLLLKKGREVAVFNAIKQNNIETVRELIADLNLHMVDSQGNSPLHLVFLSNNIDLALLLLRTYSGNVRELFFCFNKEGKTPLDLINPTSPLFKLCIECAFVSTIKLEEETHLCAVCQKQNCETRCSKCKVVYYCSQKCQKRHWKRHKRACSPTWD